MNPTCVLLTLIALLFSASAEAITIEWVTVGDPGNAADDTGYGAVAEPFRIMKYEFTNQQYAEFLNSVAASDASLYDMRMGSDARGGIAQSGSSGSYAYATKADMGDKPVNFVTWYQAARVANWLMNGATGTSSTETGAYTFAGGGMGGPPPTGPERNPSATFFIPTEDQWYKAAYYKGSGTNTGYWDYATQSSTAPVAVTANATGIGSSESTGNFANYNNGAAWNGQTGNVTTVGTNGGPSVYSAFDMSGNVHEWNDLTGEANYFRGVRGGSFNTDSYYVSSVDRWVGPAGSGDSVGVAGFRLAAPVPEPSTYAMALAGLACGGYSLFRRRRLPLVWSRTLISIQFRPGSLMTRRTREFRSAPDSRE